MTDAGDGVFHRETCRLCDGRDLELVVPIPATPVADAYVTREELDVEQPRFPLDLYFCGECSHVQLLDVVDPKLMFRHDYTYQSGNSGGIVRHFAEYASSLLERESPPPGSLVIDVGSNDGTFLRPLQEAGLQVLGIDASEGLAEAATAAGIETVGAFLDLELAARLRAERGPAKIVTANNVFAHADDLAGMAESVSLLLDAEGLFAFEVSYLIDVIEKTLLGTIFHEHLCYHTVAPLQAFLSRHGLHLIDVERNSIQGGSLVCFAQKAGGPRPESPRVAEAIRAEAVAGFLEPAVYRAFASRLARLRDDASGLLEEVTRGGAVVAGFGAARGGTTLLYALDVGDRISFIVDDDPAKQGQFTPGHHIPVLPSGTLYERRPDYVFILAWVHAKPIMHNHQRYLDEGGRFVVASPEIEVIASTPERSLSDS